MLNFLRRSKPSSPEKQPAQASAASLASPAEVLARLRSMVKNSYESLKPDPSQPPIEIRTEKTVTEQMYSGEKRLKAYAQAQQLYDNDDVGATVDSLIRLAIGTKGGTPRFGGPRKDELQKAFRAWKKSAGWEEGESFADLLAIILREVKVKGDCLILLDPYLTEGRLRIFAADQITSVHPVDFEHWCVLRGCYTEEDGRREYWRQVEGVVMDTDGRVRGYFVTTERNQYAVPMDKALYLPAQSCRRVAYKRKVTQIRGESALLPNRDLTEDTRNLLKAEVSAAKLTSELNLVLTEAPGQTGGAAKAIMQGLTAEAAAEGTDTTPEELAALIAEETQGTKLKSLQGKASLATIPNGATLSNLNNAQRPSAAIRDWRDSLADSNGKRLGVMSCLARGRADNSYSSGQIEIAISWRQIEEDQKLLERQVVDYVIDSLYGDAEYVVTWPRQFEIDPSKAENCKDAQIRGGRSTLQELIGPDWENVLEQQARELAKVRELGLTTTPYIQQQAGAAAATVSDPDKEYEK